MSFIEDKFVGMISPRLEKFKRVKAGTYNFRCPFCGDSKKNKSKARGYLYPKKSDLNYKCHNCGATATFGYFLKRIDEVLYKEYVMERYKEGLTGKGTVVPEPKIEHKKPKFVYSILKDLPKISDLNTSHPARQYLAERKIPEQHFSKLYYAEDFNAWAKTNNSYKESRIVIPLKSIDGKLFGYQGRALNPKSKLRYITTILDSEYPKVYGLNNVKQDSTVYVTEGPFDSLFVENGIAMCGADVDLSNFSWDFVYVYDNEPRNPDIHRRMEQTISRGNKIVIWPSSITQKDINDMVLSGLSPEDIIERNTFQGITAKLKFTEWKKA